MFSHNNNSQWSRKMFDIGRGGGIFGDIIIHVYICVHMPVFSRE